MRRRGVNVWLALALVGSGAAAAQDSRPAPGVEKARQILDRTLEALGGPNFLNVRDITRRGRLYSFDRGQLANPGDRFLDYVKFRGKERLEIGKDGKLVYLNDNDQGWELDRQGIREMTPEAIENFQQSNQRDFEYLLRFRLRQERLQLYYLGLEFVDNRRAHVIELVDGSNQSVKLVIDVATHLPAQLRYRHRDALTGEWMDEAERYGKYVTVQGVKTPMHLTRQRAGQRVFEVYFSEVQYNTGVADALFTRASLEERWRKVR